MNIDADLVNVAFSGVFVSSEPSNSSISSQWLIVDNVAQQTVKEN